MVHIEDELMIAAPPERLFAALQRELEERAVAVSRTEDGLVADFATKVGPLTFRTRERAILRPPERIDFQHLRGPFRSCSESLHLIAAEGGTLVKHTADFSLWLPLVGDLVGRLVAGPIFQAVVRQHLGQIKEKLEAEAAAS